MKEELNKAKESQNPDSPRSENWQDPQKPRDPLECDPPEKEGPKERKKPSFGPNETIQDKESWVSKKPQRKVAKLPWESRAKEQRMKL